MTVNEDHEPSDAQDRVLVVFKQEIEDHGESRMTPQLIRERMAKEPSKQYVNYALSQLTAAGWVRKIVDGLYEFVEDPRDE